ncbi:MAG: hypothetical protein KKE20_03185, partial [Nanoarchaeota archaeon]|nr:hypothetical protein [Nanoarchaeota archaeon]
MERQDEPKINSILSYTWYPHDMPMTPHLIWPAIEVFARARYGLGYSIGSLFIKDRNGRYGFAEEDLDRVGRFFFDNPLEILKLASAWEEKKSAYKSEIKKIRNLTMLSEKEMHSLYHGFYTAYVGQYSIPALANTLDFYFENWLKAIADPQDFFKLTAPAKESFIQREQKELLSIRKNKDFGANIENHAKKYFWLGNNYSHTKILSKDYFIRRHETEKYAEISKPDKKDLMKKYKISESLMKAVEECIYWRDERKKLNMIGNHYLCVLLEEIGK